MTINLPLSPFSISSGQPHEDWLPFFCSTSSLMDIHVLIGKGCVDEATHVEAVDTARMDC